MYSSMKFHPVHGGNLGLLFEGMKIHLLREKTLEHLLGLLSWKIGFASQLVLLVAAFSICTMLVVFILTNEA